MFGSNSKQQCGFSTCLNQNCGILFCSKNIKRNKNRDKRFGFYENTKHCLKTKLKGVLTGHGK